MKRNATQDAVAERMSRALNRTVYTEKTMAKTLGIPTQRLKRYLEGVRKPPDEFMERFAAVAGVSPEYLWGKEPPVSLDLVIEPDGDVTDPDLARLSHERFAALVEHCAHEVRRRLIRPTP